MNKRVVCALALLGACDEDNPARHLDGGTVDSPTVMVDAPKTTDPVTLTITANAIPQAGVVVHFQNADSTLVATEVTDSIGVASHVMAAGGYVTAVDPFAGAAGLATSTLRTFAGVKPGDHLKLTSGSSTEYVDMTITLPVQPDTETKRYRVNSPCSSSPSDFVSTGSGFQPIGNINFASTCTTADILVTSYDINDALIGYFFVPGETVTANGSLDYHLKSYATPTSRTYTFANQPAGMSPIGVEQHLGNTAGELVDISANASDVGVATLGIPTVPNPIGVLQAGARLGSSYHTLFDWGPLATTAYTTDVGARKLVDISGATYDVAAHALTWTEGTGAAPQLDYVELFATRTTATSTFGVAWNIVAPHAAGQLTLPVLPVGAVDYNIDADDPVNIYGLSLLKVPGGYDAIRANGFALEDLVTLGNEFPLAANGTGSAELVRYAPLQPELRGHVTR